MSGHKLFAQRWWEDFKFQGRAIHTIMDWTIFLYLFIPGSAFLIIYYRSWWLDTPAWIEGIPITIVFIVMYIASRIGGYRTFLLEADQLFLLQRRILVSSLKKWTIAYSVILQWTGMLLFFILFLPFLIGYYQLATSEIIQLFFFFSLSKSHILLTRRRIDVVGHRGLRLLYSGLIFVASGSVIVSISTLVIGQHPIPLWTVSGLIFILLSKDLYSWIMNQSNALTDIELDRKEKMKYVKFILMHSAAVPKQMNVTRKRPWLFRNSGRIYRHRTRENGMVELFIKVFFRNGMYLFDYLRLIGITLTGLVILPPIWLKCVLFGVFMLAARLWMESVWKTITSKPLLVALLGDAERLLTAKRRVLRLFLTPSFILVAMLGAWFTWIFSLFT